jgi:hypothetical protein
MSRGFCRSLEGSHETPSELPGMLCDCPMVLYYAFHTCEHILSVPSSVQYPILRLAHSSLWSIMHKGCL